MQIFRHLPKAISVQFTVTVRIPTTTIENFTKSH